MTRGWSRVLPFVLLAAARSAAGYAVFTHQALIDAAWDRLIRPALLARFPGMTEPQLDEAHAYAYGGSAIQDLGYYPFGKGFFSDLTHYVRSGAFVSALFDVARGPNDYAFAIGALSHYVGDSVGHSEAINPSTVIAFPKLKRKYGQTVTYEDAPIDHIRTEFGFDVAQIARRRYAPNAYQKYIGLRVAGRALDRAFYQTYGFRARGLLGPLRPAIASYRRSVRAIFPEFAKATVVLMRHRLPFEAPDAARQRFVDALAATDYSRHWSNRYTSPGIGAHVLAFVILPKVGPLRILSIKAPVTETEDLFAKSFDAALTQFGELLRRVEADPPLGGALPDRDLDTGELVKAGAYRRADNTYAKLLEKVTTPAGKNVPSGLREAILSYYSDPSAPIDTKKHPKAWARVQRQLEILRSSESHP